LSYASNLVSISIITLQDLAPCLHLLPSTVRFIGCHVCPFSDVDDVGLNWIGPIEATVNALRRVDYGECEQQLGQILRLDFTLGALFHCAEDARRRGGAGMVPLCV